MIIIYGFLLTLNLIVSVLPLWHSKNYAVSIPFALSGFSLTFWIMGNFFLATNIDVIFWERFCLASMTIAALSFLLFTLQYPKQMIPIKSFLVMVLLIITASMFLLIYTPFVVVSGTAMDNIQHGFGYTIFSLYFISYLLTSIVILIRNVCYGSSEIRSKIFYILIGLSCSLILGSTTNLFLPLFFNVTKYTYIGPIFASAFIFSSAYSILKRNLIDIRVIVGESLAYIILVSFVLVSFGMAYFFLAHQQIPQILFLSILAIFWAIYGERFKEFLITTAKRKFIKGYYDQDQVLSELSKKIGKEQNRPTLIQTVETVIDDNLHFEDTGILYGIRDPKDNVIAYHLTYRPPIGDPQHMQLALTDPLITVFTTQLDLIRLRDIEASAQITLKSFKFKPQALLIPLRSIEGLEGLLILGERSGGLPIRETELDFLRTIQQFINAILFGLTPLEKAEQKYVQTKKKEHDSEKKALLSDRIKSMSDMIQEYNHEIRTPLQVITTNVYLMPDTEELRTYRSKIIESIDSIDDIVTTTLKLSQEMSNYKRIEEKIELCSFVKEIIEKFPVPPSVKVMIESKDPISEMIGVKEDLKKVIHNLTQNAIEAMPNGGSLTLTLSEVGEEVLVSIADTGVGIPKANLHEIWTPFKSSHVTKGRGLGLSIVFRLVSEHGGHIDVVSAEGKGATFTLRFQKS